MQSEMTELLAILQHQDQQSGWLNQVYQDVRHLTQLVLDSVLARNAGLGDVQQLAQYSCEHPHALTKLCKQSIKVYSLYLDSWSQLRAFQQAFTTEATHYGIVFHDALLSPAGQCQFACHLCKTIFADYKSLCSHAFAQHGLANVAPSFAIGNTCRACLNVYHSRTQLVYHLKYYKTGYLLKLSVSVPPLDASELEEIRQTAREGNKQRQKQQRNKEHKWPVVQAHGPVRPWPWVRHRALVCHDGRPDPNIPAAEL